MDRNDLIAGIERLRPWFHCIELAPGLYTKTESIAGEPVDHPQPTWETVGRCLPADLSGKSVLDVGCNAGFYAVEARRRGASRVLGIDAQRREIRQAQFVRHALNLDIEFRRLSVYDLSPASVGQFEITLALGLVYHLKHLVLALENLYRVTRELLILETAILPLDRTPPSFVHPLGGLPVALHPLAFIENPTSAAEAVYNWFLPSPAALTALLKSVGFTAVSTFVVRGERAIAVCRRDPAAAGALAHLAASLTLEAGPTSIATGEAIDLRVRATNTGSATWPVQETDGAERGIVRLGAHLLRPDGEEVAWDYGRAALPHAILPGQSVTLDLRLPSPPASGRYTVELDMVAEGLTWFEDLGSPLLSHTVDVR